MNRKSVLWILLDLVFLAVFNTVFLVMGGTKHPASVWISYGFIHFSYVMVLLTPILTRKSRRSDIFGLSLGFISSVYFLIEFITGIVFILIKQESINIALSVQVIIAGIYAVILLSYMIANESTADSIERHEDEVAFIKQSASKVKGLIEKADNGETAKIIEKVYDLIHSSPSKSVPSAHEIEIAIKNKICELDTALDAKDDADAKKISEELITLIKNRNELLRSSQ